MTLVPLPAFADNYIWMLQDGRHAIWSTHRRCRAGLRCTRSRNLQLAAILSLPGTNADHCVAAAPMEKRLPMKFLARRLPCRLAAARRAAQAPPAPGCDSTASTTPVAASAASSTAAAPVYPGGRADAHHRRQRPLARRRHARAAGRHVGPHPPRLQDARPRQRAGARPRAVVCEPARLHPAHDRALEQYIFHIVEELERRNMPTELALLPYIESAFNPQAVSSATRRRHVAVHARHRHRLRPQAEHVPRRPARRAGLHPRRARLPAEALRHVRRLAPRAGRLQLGRRQRGPRHRQEPARRPAHRLHRPQHAGRDAATTCPSCRR